MIRRGAILLGIAFVGCGRDSTPLDEPAAPSAISASCVPPGGEWSPANVGAATFIVNRATRGMTARIRWTLSPDSSALLVVEDPTGVENEAIPDGVMFASERTGRAWRMDSVWSVAPSQDWKKLAYGRAVVLRNGESNSIPEDRWVAAASSLASIAGAQPSLVPDSLRAHAFPVSGMTVAMGAAATFVIDVPVDSASPPSTFAGLGGWTVAWECDARAVARVVIGPNPTRVQNAEPASAMWVTGPTLDIGASVARDSVRRLVVREREIEGRRGVIAVRDSGGKWRDVGRGIPLAATRGGRFILALAARTGARAYESPDHTVVYRVP